MNGEERSSAGSGGGPARTLMLVLGPLLSAALLLFCDLDPERPSVTGAAAVALLMAIWWISEALPLPATSLLPVVLFPLLGVMNGKAVAATYFNHIVFLFIGGFIVALAMERWNLHRRIALRILLLFGVHPARILLGFMVASWFLSMWISNTAATMMMVTIALAIILELEKSAKAADGAGSKRLGSYPVGLLLGVAYGATVGGLATLVGTPPNMSFTRIFEITFPAAPAISFAGWFLFALPISLALLFASWLVLLLMFRLRPGVVELDRELLRRQYRELGPWSFAEKVVLVDFALLVLLWLLRSDLEIGSLRLPGWSGLLPEPGHVNDGTVAILMALLLFAVPSRRHAGERLMDWRVANRLPWGIVLLFGGGFALATGFAESGLSDWMGRSLKDAAPDSPVQLIGVLCLSVTFLTELTSNTATTEMILPVLAGLSRELQLNPLLLMIPVTLSCSCAFMMPVATPPNAIVFGTERIRIREMVRCGLILNLVGAVVILLGMLVVGTRLFEIDPAVFPAWATAR